MSDLTASIHQLLAESRKLITQGETLIAEFRAAFADWPSPEAAFSEPDEPTLVDGCPAGFPQEQCSSTGNHGRHYIQSSDPDFLLAYCPGRSNPPEEDPADELVETIVTRVARLLFLRQVARTITDDEARYYSGHEADIDWAWQDLLGALNTWKDRT